MFSLENWIAISFGSVEIHSCCFIRWLAILDLNEAKRNADQNKPKVIAGIDRETTAWMAAV